MNNNYARKRTTEIPILSPVETDYFRPKKRVGLHERLVPLKWPNLLFVTTLWIAVMYHFQRVKPGMEIEKCQWSNWETYPSGVKPHRVLLIADPQIVDDHTYPKRPRIIQYFTRKISDNYMANNYKLMQEKLEPDTTIFLGDLFDGGREWFDDAKWYDEWKRFNRIFPKYPNRQSFFNILGNHDAGWDATMNRTLTDRFKLIFGDSNDFQTIGNHTFLFLDTIALSATNNNDSSILEEAREYFDKLTEEILPKRVESQKLLGQSEMPNILLTHVPLFRDPSKQPCRGPRESKRPFPLVNGGTFQTVLFPELTNELLHKLRPKLVFSGDDHDFCEIDHYYAAYDKETGGHNNVKTKEITVKSYSMNMGVKYPAAQLLSLYNPVDKKDSVSSLVGDSETYQTEICYPYAPFTTLTFYGGLLLFTISYWVTLCFYPSTYLALESKIAQVTYPILKKLANNLPVLQLLFTRLGVDWNDSVYLSIDPFSPVSHGAVNEKFGNETSLLYAKNLKKNDKVGFAVNFTTQLVTVFLLFAYFYTFI